MKKNLQHSISKGEFKICPNRDNRDNRDERDNRDTPHTPQTPPLSPLLLFCFSALLLFCALPSSAQSYTVFSNDFEKWTDGMPDGWENISAFNDRVSPYTPAYSGSYACKYMMGIAQTSCRVAFESTESFPVYWGKKYVFSFTAKVLGCNSVKIPFNLQITYKYDVGKSDS